MSFAINVTIIIPTLNRSDFIIKMLRAFQETDFGGKVLIGDSSNDYHYNKTRDNISSNNYKYEINQYPFPGLKNFDCIGLLNSKVETSYLMWMCDDDILVPRTLEKAAIFLSENEEYSGVGGVGIVLGINEGDYEKVEGSERYELRSVEGSSATSRLLELSSAYRVTAYSLCRTEQFIKKFKPYVDSSLSDVAIGAELLPTLMQAVQGKIKFLDDLFVVRQIHYRRYILPDIYDWITSSGWLDSQRILINTIAHEIEKVEKISINEAEKIARDAFYFYLRNAMKFKPKTTLKTKIRQQISEKLKIYPKIHSILKEAMLTALGWKNPFSLSALLSPKSKYYKDFHPIYRSIVTPTKN
jgi:glycosyltransferase domain-containing protein